MIDMKNEKYRLIILLIAAITMYSCQDDIM